jgi:hypothetical protein
LLGSLELDSSVATRAAGFVVAPTTIPAGPQGRVPALTLCRFTPPSYTIVAYATPAPSDTIRMPFSKSLAETVDRMNPPSGHPGARTPSTVTRTTYALVGGPAGRASRQAMNAPPLSSEAAASHSVVRERSEIRTPSAVQLRVPSASTPSLSGPNRYTHRDSMSHNIHYVTLKN